MVLAQAAGKAVAAAWGVVWRIYDVRFKYTEKVNSGEQAYGVCLDLLGENFLKGVGA